MHSIFGSYHEYRLWLSFRCVLLNTAWHTRLPLDWTQHRKKCLITRLWKLWLLTQLNLLPAMSIRSTSRRSVGGGLSIAMDLHAEYTHLTLHSWVYLKNYRSLKKIDVIVRFSAYKKVMLHIYFFPKMKYFTYSIEYIFFYLFAFREFTVSRCIALLFLRKIYFYNNLLRSPGSDNCPAGAKVLNWSPC